MGLRERGGDVRAFQVPAATGIIARDVAEEHISVDAELVCTDESRIYLGLKKMG